MVDGFVAVHRQITIVEDETAEQRDVMRRITESRADRTAHADDARAHAPQATAASSEVLAFVSLARIASGDGSVGDVLALSSNLIATSCPA